MTREEFAMKISTVIFNASNGIRLAMLAAALWTIGTVALLSATPAATTTLTVVNNSTHEIHRLYLSPTDSNLWGPDQLNESYISPGATRTLNVTWEQPTVKVVAEDEDGCFLDTTVEATGNPVWTITSDATRNCGG
jgi:hypothetical protein